MLDNATPTEASSGQKVALNPVNWFLFFLGMAVVWFSTHSVVAVLGAWVASIHITVHVKGKGAPHDKGCDRCADLRALLVAPTLPDPRDERIKDISGSTGR